MGVALISSRSGSTPASAAREGSRAKAIRWLTPKRCCSSTMPSPMRGTETPSCMRAWVPTTKSTSPLPMRSVVSLRAAAESEPR